jgi:hypothetical protein
MLTHFNGPAVKKVTNPIETLFALQRNLYPGPFFFLPFEKL